MERTVKEWEKRRTDTRRAHEIREAINMERGLVLSPARKRGGDHTTIPSGPNPTTNTTTSPGRNSNPDLKRKQCSAN